MDYVNPDRMSPAQHYQRGLGYLGEATEAVISYGAGSPAVPAYAALATAHFAASQAAMFGVLGSEEIGTFVPVSDAVEKIGNDWGVQLGLSVAPVPDPEPETDPESTPVVPEQQQAADA
jgi:hypothetical protein